MGLMAMAAVLIMVSSASTVGNSTGPTSIGLVFTTGSQAALLVGAMFLGIASRG